MESMGNQDSKMESPTMSNSPSRSRVIVYPFLLLVLYQVFCSIFNEFDDKKILFLCKRIRQAIAIDKVL